MKIAHLTFHASHNYGSVLQAYALSKQLQLMGHQVSILNLRPKAQTEAYRVIRSSDKGLHLAFRLMLYPWLKKRFKEYERFINGVLPIGRETYTSTKDLENLNLDYDAYVCGGDQIWNPCCQDFETAYYLQFLKESDQAKRIAYAPSLGRTEFPPEICAHFRDWLKAFDHISVREKRGAELLQRYTEKTVHTVCDPVLLLDASYWRELSIAPKVSKPYILTYFLENNHGSRSCIESIRRKTGYLVVNLNEYIRDFIRPYKKAYAASPEQFVGLFEHASFIYTNSFHGTAFATLFEKPFITSIAADQANAQNNNDSRKIDYLKLLALDENLYTMGEPNWDAAMAPNYAQANRLLKNFRKMSYGYLEDALNS